jgi:hypothetical protein
LQVYGRKSLDRPQDREKPILGQNVLSANAQSDDMTVANSFRKRKSRKGQMLTPKTKQARVVAAAIVGKSKAQIAREQHLSTPTVRRILSQSEVKALLAGYQDEARELLPWALKVCKRNLKSTRPSWQLAVELLKGLQVLISRAEKEVTHLVDEVYSWKDDELREYLQTGKLPASAGQA